MVCCISVSRVWVRNKWVMYLGDQWAANFFALRAARSDPINRIIRPQRLPPGPLKTHYLNYFRSLLGVLGPWRHAYYRWVKFLLWTTLCSPRKDDFYVPCWHVTGKFLLMKFCDFGRMGISRTDYCFYIIAMCMRNRIMGIPSLEDGLENLFLFEYFWGIPPPPPPPSAKRDAKLVTIMHMLNKLQTNWHHEQSPARFPPG